MMDARAIIFKILPQLPAVFQVILLGCWMVGSPLRLAAADSAGAQATAPAPVAHVSAVVETNAAPRFNVVGYTVQGNPALSTNVLVAVFSKYAGPDVTLEELVKAASDLQLAYRNQGYPGMSVAVVPGQITNGIVTMNIFQAVIPQIVVAGRRYPGLSPGLEIAATPATNPVVNPLPAAPALAQQTAAAPPVVATNAVSPVILDPTKPASAEEMTRAHAFLLQKMAEVTAHENDTRIHVISTNTGPRFEVAKYIIMGNSVLSPQTLAEVLTNIDGAYGTNVSFEGVRTALAELQGAYHERGYVTVTLGLPQQKLTNATIKVQVTEGRLAEINVKYLNAHHYFSSNNVMRALPSLHTNMVLNGPIFQAELNRANANQDRQIYPLMSPGLDPGTSDLTLRVKDQLPLHAKVEYNNQSSPGTPDTRINTSAVYNNLWDLDQSVGAQYSFSPQQYKTGNWPFYDQPLVANYSTFYRMPLGGPTPIGDEIASSPGNFGYDEATHKFNLPAPTGQPDLTVFASRSSIDTGLETLSDTVIFSDPGVREITLKKVQQDITYNDDVGFRASMPILETMKIHSSLSGGIDYKSYTLDSYKTNIFADTEITYDNNGNQVVRTAYIYNPVPPPGGLTFSQLQYLPLTLRYDGSLGGPLGLATFGLGISANTWYTGSRSNLQFITGSTESSGYWFILNPSFAWQFTLQTNWPASFRTAGQWASQPLISNEQFGIGGVNSVRGYHEGEDFGDTGWYGSLEQSTPSLKVGPVYGNTPLSLRGSIYMDIGSVYLLDPQGRPSYMELWSAGTGVTAAIGSHWEARFLFSVPLIGTINTPQDQPYFNFGLTAQF